MRFLQSAAIAALLLGPAVALTAPAVHAQDKVTRASTKVSVETFREKLRPIGEYVEIKGLGEAWKPGDVADDWQPYSVGHWIFNDKVGWYFESDEPWAEITYHYGRWYDDPDHGWVWIAGTEWAPAWVEWRRSREFVGWRPLPPENAPRRVSTRSRTTTTTTRRTRGGSDAVEEIWIFVPQEKILVENIETVRVERRRVVEIYERAEPIGRVERRGGITVNFALAPEVIERESRIDIKSRNLPQAVAAPVPEQIRSIATETRSSSTTTGTSTGTSATQSRQAPEDATGTAEPRRQSGTSGTETTTTGTAGAKERESGRSAGQPPAPERGSASSAAEPSGSKADSASRESERTRAGASGSTEKRDMSTKEESRTGAKPSGSAATRQMEERERANARRGERDGSPEETTGATQQRPSTSPSGREENRNQQRQTREEHRPAQQNRGTAGSDTRSTPSGVKARPPQQEQRSEDRRGNGPSTTGATSGERRPPMEAGSSGQERSQGMERRSESPRASEPGRGNGGARAGSRGSDDAATTGSTERRMPRTGGAGRGAGDVEQ